MWEGKQGMDVKAIEREIEILVRVKLGLADRLAVTTDEEMKKAMAETNKRVEARLTQLWIWRLKVDDDFD